MEMSISQNRYFLSYAWGAANFSHLKQGVFCDLLVKMSKNIPINSISTQKTNVFLLDKLLRHTYITILTTGYL